MKNPYNKISDINELLKLKEDLIKKDIKDKKKHITTTLDKKGRKTIKYKFLEDFRDEDTGEIVTIDREEYIVKNDVFFSDEFSGIHRKKSLIDRRIDKILKDANKKLITDSI